MLVYITYFVYEGDEYSLWDVSTSRMDAINTFKSKHVPFFIEGHQSDLSNLVLVEANISRADYAFLTTVDTANDNSSEELDSILLDIEESFSTDYIYSIDGYINEDFARYYGISKGIPAVDLEDDVTLELEELDKLEETNPAEYASLLKNFITNYFA